MHVERASEDIYIFTSERYAQVTASLIVSGNTGVLIDTLPFPEETAQIALLAHKRCPDGVRYIIYTQHEADHIYGAYLFPRAEIVAHSQARDYMIAKAYAALEQAKTSSKEFEHVSIRLPSFTFSQGTFTLRLPGKTLEIFPTPGHTPDSVSVLLHEERLLFAGDTVMAIPTIANGDVNQLKDSLTRIAGMQLESIVQGHGEMILRGEIKEVMRRSVAYLDNLQAKVQQVVESGGTREQARAITIESCGLQRVLLNGMVGPLHNANVLALYDRMKRYGIPAPTPTSLALAAALADDGVVAAKPAKASKSKAAKAVVVEVEPEEIEDEFAAEDAEAEEPDMAEMEVEIDAGDAELDDMPKTKRKPASKSTTKSAAKPKPAKAAAKANLKPTVKPAATPAAKPTAKAKVAAQPAPKSSAATSTRKTAASSASSSAPSKVASSTTRKTARK